MLFFLALFCVSYIGALSTIPIHEISFPADFSQTKSCILCDLDGTLLNSEHTVSEENIVTIQEAMKNGWRFIPATGRTRVSMRNAVGEDVIQRLFGDGSRMPGIYQQGLMVFGLNGELIYERLLEQEVIEMAVSFCKEENLSLIAYAGDRVFCERRTLETDKVVAYKDPEPETFSQGLHKLHTEGIHVHKLIVVADPLKIPSIRSKMVPFLANKATFTQAVPDMLEILPLGGCKGEGVKHFLDHIDVDSQNAVAFGDGENDVEMMQLVGYGVAMANAKPALHAVAKYVTGLNNANGVATGIQAIMAAYLVSKNSLESVVY